MTHPGMAFVYAVGIGLATIFYYMYANANNNNQHNPHGGNSSNGGPPPDPNNSWSPPNSRSNTNRQPSITSGSTPSCTICLTDISMVTIVHILPCGHPFHRKCIEKWQNQGELSSHDCCPNCRRKIEVVR